MSLTYLIVKDWCATCGRRELREIARSAAGNRMFARGESRASWADELHAAQLIETEYGEAVGASEILERAHAKREERADHPEGRADQDVWLLPEPYWQDRLGKRAADRLSSEERELLREFEDEMVRLVGQAAIRLATHRGLKRLGMAGESVREEEA